MSIEDFLNGFRYFRDNERTIITDLMEADSYEWNSKMYNGYNVEKSVECCKTNCW